MSGIPTIGSIVFNPAPDAALGVSLNSQTLMLSYGALSPQQMLDRIATLERENAELRESLLKQRELTGAFIESSAIIASENQRLRAHIQEGKK